MGVLQLLSQTHRHSWVLRVDEETDPRDAVWINNLKNLKWCTRTHLSFCRPEPEADRASGIFIGVSPTDSVTSGSIDPPNFHPRTQEQELPVRLKVTLVRTPDSASFPSSFSHPSRFVMKSLSIGRLIGPVRFG